MPDIVLYGQNTEGEGYRSVAKHNGKGALEAEPEVGGEPLTRGFLGGCLLHGSSLEFA